MNVLVPVEVEIACAGDSHGVPERAGERVAEDRTGKRDVVIGL